ncbi:AraC family transcriptional regulator [Paenibacillus sp. LHD-38]|uniref:AraC family transcriptional regulator n=1 Tax=Paenibacillus sp. LHD-38 TaxID=3072143 RepID=UPI00280C87D3|nr:AraC family transcriptional regulator [Paenibacillus sp. LHD-38]MDQ8738137.1 AraC family transcriptional regulator [Paenibacillus sp. LHD-38]
MKRIPMMLQLALILFFVMAIPTAILTWYSGAQILWSSETAIGESALAGVDANRKLNENSLDNLAQNTVRLAATNIFDRIRRFDTYDEINANYINISSALSVQREMLNLNHFIDGVYSSYFYLNDSDYVISTDGGISKLERYESIEWMKDVLSERSGITGVWFPRKLNSGVSVVSYVLPLNRLTTTTRGIIVVNLKESEIGSYLKTTEPGVRGYFLLSSDGKVISSNDKSVLFTDGGKQPFIENIASSGLKEGYAFHELNGERLLYTWSRSKTFGWLNVKFSSVDPLMTKTHTLQRNILFLTILIIFVGIFLAIFLATWLSKPARELVRIIRSRNNLGMKDRNELAFLDAAFKRMQDEEEGLHKLLKEREKDSQNLAIHQLLRGEDLEKSEAMYPAHYYRVAIVSIDRYRQYMNQTNPETRSYHRYLLISQCESLFMEGINTRSVYQGEGCFAIIINFEINDEEDQERGIRQTLLSIREQAAKLLGHSVTIGVSGLTESAESISDRLVEAMEVIKHRMIVGSGGITYWKEEEVHSQKYIDPIRSERRILNYLDAGDLNGIYKELEDIRAEIQSVEYISYDNILFIYNHLTGATIKHLRENHVSAARIFANRGNIYSTLTSIDTLDELENYLRNIYGEIVQHLARKSGETNYGERIIRHLEEHYREEIVFEDMAKEIGISYSYMRKIVYELTGKSLIDYLNQLRIEKAKGLLVEKNLTIVQIAEEVGYYNVQSFKRFFRKYEGMPPNSYRGVRRSSQGVIVGNGDQK